MWGSLLIIDHLISPVSEEILRAKEPDKLVLTWEQRRWVRGRFTTDKGRKIGLALPTGTTLPPSAILWIEPDWYLRVEAATESVLTHDDRFAFGMDSRLAAVSMVPGRMTLAVNPAPAFSSAIVCTSMASAALKVT